MKLRRILLSTDLSQESERPHRAVIELAREAGASIRLLHVVEDVMITPPLDGPILPPLVPPDLSLRMKQARETLAEHAGRLAQGVPVDCDVISASNVAEAIADYAFQNDFDLLALSTHGRTGFRRMVMGSVAELVIRHARVPVLVFPRHE